MTALDNAPAKNLALGNSGERDDDHARAEIFSVPPKSDSEQGTASGDTTPVKAATSLDSILKKDGNQLGTQLEIPPVATGGKAQLKSAGNTEAEERFFSRPTTVAEANNDVNEKTNGKRDVASGVTLSKEHPSPLVSAAAFNALRRDLGVDLTKPGAFKPDPENPEQIYFANRLPDAVQTLERLPKGVEIKGKASKEVGPVNEFLKQQGFDIQLKDQKDPTSLYLAGTLKVTDDWSAKARQMVANDGKSYDSVQKLGTVFTVDGVRMAEIHNNPEKGIKVYAIPMPENLSGYEVNQRAETLLRNMSNKMVGGGAQDIKNNALIEFPMVDMNSQQDITGLIGLGTDVNATGRDLYIKQAKMQTIVQMDESGFLAKQAAAFGMVARSAQIDPPVDFQVKDKFIFAVTTTSGDFVVATHIGQENWKRPPKREAAEK
jgi:hypothetical protein